MKKQLKYMKQCKEALWKRWKHEYLEVCKEKHNLKHKDKTFKINVGDLLMVKGKKKNQGHWNIDIVKHLYIGKDNIIRVAQLRIRKKLIDRPIQLLYLLEIYCEGITITNEDEIKNELHLSAT